MERKEQKSLRGKLRRMLSILLSGAMVLGLLNVPGFALRAKADGITMMLINDSADGTGGRDKQRLYDDADASGTGWSWDSANKTLHLSNFNGSYIEALDAVTIVLKGSNTVHVVPALAQDGVVYGIKGPDTEKKYKTTTFQTDAEDSDATLSVIGNFGNSDVTAYLIHAGVASFDSAITSNFLQVKSGALFMTATGENATIVGIKDNNLYFYNDASLDVNIEGKQGNGVDGEIQQQSAKDINIRVKFSSATDALGKNAALRGVNLKNSGSVTIINESEGGYALCGEPSDRYGAKLSCSQEATGSITIDGKMFFLNKNYIDYNNAGYVDTLHMEHGYTFGSSQLQYGSDSAKNGFVPFDDKGNEIEHMKLEKKDIDHLVLAYTEMHLTGLQVGKAYTSNTITGDVIGGKRPYQLSVVSGSLPVGLTVNGQYDKTGCVSGTPEEMTPAGSAVIRVTDSSETSLYMDLTVSWDAVAAGTFPTTDIQVGATTFSNQTNASGEGWSYDKGTNTLTLDNYNGGAIQTTKTLKMKVKGQNKITVTAAKPYGLKNSSTFYVTAGDENASLAITGDLGESTATVYGVQASRIEMTDVDLAIELEGKYARIYGIDGASVAKGTSSFQINLSGSWVCGSTGNSCMFANDSSLSMNLQGTSGYGAAGLVYGSTKPGSVSVDLADAPTDKTCVAAKKLQVSGSGAFLLKNARKGGYALRDSSTSNDGTVLNVTSEATSVEIVGRMFLEQAGFFPRCSYSLVDTLHEENGYAFRFVKEGSRMGVIPFDHEGNEITHMKFEKKTTNSLVIPYTERTMTGLKAGTAYSSREFEGDDIFLNGAVHGGSGRYQYTVKEGSLPAGLSIDTIYGSIKGTPTQYMETTEQGYSAVIEITDKNDDSLHAEVTIRWAGVEANIGVTGVELTPETVQIAAGETAELTATVSPANATCTDVKFTTNSKDVADANLKSLSKTDNVSTVNVEGLGAGRATITATTVEGKWTKTCAVTVIEATPNAQADTDADGLYFKGLVANASYTVDGTAYTADADGKIKGLPKSLLGKTVSVIKTNADATLNSAAQSLSLADIKLVLDDSVVKVEDLSKNCTGAEQEPTFGGSLTRGTDYEVSYAVKTGEAGGLGANGKPKDAGVYVVTVSGKGKYAGSFTKEMTLAKQAGPAAPTGLATVAASAKGAADGKITGVTDTMEYSASSDFGTAVKCTETTVTGLTAGIYYVRVAETATTLAGLAKAVTVLDGPGAFGAIVSITGTAKYGETLTASVEIASGDSAAEDLSFQWYRVNGETRTAISGATSKTYKLVEADIDKRIACDVTSAKETGTQSGITTVKIDKTDGPEAPSGLGAVAATMKGKADGQITGTKSGMEYSVNEDFSIASNIHQITGSTVTGLVAGTYYVRVAGTSTTKAGAAAEVTVGDGPAVLTGKVTISGNAQYGQKLTASVTNTNNSGILKYQWKRDGEAISGKTLRTYQIVKEDVGKVLSCEVTSTVELNSITGMTSGKIEKADSPLPSGITVAAATEKGAADGKIMGVSTEMEYASKEDFSDAKACTGTEITGLVAGTYYVRYAETEIAKVGAARAISVEDGVAKLTGTLKVIGSLKYGENLLASVTESNNTGVSYYQWMRDGETISGATAQSYNVTEGDIGHVLSVTVKSSVELGSLTASASGAITKADGPAAPSGLTSVPATAKGKADGKISGTKSGMEYSTDADFGTAANVKKINGYEVSGLAAGTYYVRVAETNTAFTGKTAKVIVKDGPDVLNGVVTISGSVKYGETLMATVTGDNNTGSLAYQWKRVADGTATAISGATENTYCLTKEDIGSMIVCEVTSSYETGSISNQTSTAVAKMDGPAAPGGLTATAASAKGKADGKISGTKSGMEYSTDMDFSKAENVKKITETSVTGLVAGTYYVRIAETDTVKAGSAATVTVADGPGSLGGTVSISGSLKYGETLTVTVSGSNNSGTLKYQWKRGTTAISGATASTYKLVEGDIGQTLACVVTSTVETGSISAQTTAAIAKADGPAAPSGLTATAASVKGALDGKISGTKSGMEYSTDADFSKAENVKKITETSVTGLAAGTYYVRVAETATVKAGASVAVVIKDGANTLAGTVTITGSLKYGETLTAVAENDVNNTGELKYQWKRGESAINGATERNYKLTKEDIGKRIQCVVTSTVEIGSISGTTDEVIAKADGPAAPQGLKGSTVSVKGALDGKITGTESGMEYSTDADFSVAGNIVKITAEEVTGLAAGAYYVRWQETDTLAAGKAALVVVLDAPEALTGDFMITGDLRYGAQLVVVNQKSNNSGVLRYQWKRGDEVIEGATDSVYRLVKEDVGHKLTVVITSTVETGSIILTTKEAIVKVAGQAVGNLTAVATSSKGASDGKITGTKEGMEYSTDEDFSKPENIVKITGEEVTGLKAGTYYVRNAESDGMLAGPAKKCIVVDGTESLTGTVSISGNLKFGGTLAVTVSGSNNSGTMKYQWKRMTDGTATEISGATAATYQPTKEDIGRILACVVTSTVETGSISAQTSEVIAMADGPAAPSGLTTTAASAKGKADGKISGTKSGMEYSTDADFSKAENVKKITETSVTGLAAGTYYVRIAETDTAKAGSVATVTVEDGPEEQEPETLIGDVNGNGKVDRADRMYLARALAGWDGYEIKNKKAADVNRNGKVDRADRMYLARALAGWDGYKLN